MHGIRGEFAQFGDFDSFDIIRSETSMVDLADHELPAPIITGLTTMYFVDTSVVVGHTYYYKARVHRGALSYVSDEEVSALVGSPWTPAYLLNPAKIFSDTDSLIAGGLSVLENKGSIAAHFVQATQARQPLVVENVLNGHAVIRLDGAGDYIAMQSTEVGALFRNISVGWCFTVFKRTSGSLLFDVREPSGGARFLSQTTATSISFSSRRLDSNSTASTSVAANVGEFGIRFDRLNYSSANLMMRYNGDEVFNSTHGTAGTTSNTQAQSNYVAIGERAGNLTGTSWGGDIACIIVGSGTTPTNDEILKLEGWAAHKYGLQSNLPVDHPYKIIPPLL